MCSVFALNVVRVKSPPQGFASNVDDQLEAVATVVGPRASSLPFHGLLRKLHWGAESPRRSISGPSRDWLISRGHGGIRRSAAFSRSCGP